MGPPANTSGQLPRRGSHGAPTGSERSCGHEKGGRVGGNSRGSRKDRQRAGSETGDRFKKEFQTKTMAMRWGLGAP